MPHSHPLPRILAVAVAASLSFTTTGVRAQDDGLKLEEVYVTARRTSENLQDVPVSVQVISGSTIDELAMTTPEELSKLTPGLTLRLPEPQNPVIILRDHFHHPAA